MPARAGRGLSRYLGKLDGRLGIELRNEPAAAGAELRRLPVSRARLALIADQPKQPESPTHCAKTSSIALI